MTCGKRYAAIPVLLTQQVNSPNHNPSELRLQEALKKAECEAMHGETNANYRGECSRNIVVIKNGRDIGSLL